MLPCPGCVELWMYQHLQVMANLLCPVLQVACDTARPKGVR